MQDPEEVYSSEDNASMETQFAPEDEDDSRYERNRLWRLIPGAVTLMASLVVFTTFIVTMEPHRRNIFFAAFAGLLVFMFLFAALIVRSYDRDKKKLIQQDPYRNDHIVQ